MENEAVLIDDRELDIMPFSPLCTRCKHLESLAPRARRCLAFNEIPLKIWNGEKSHDKVHPKQLGNIVFEPKE